jgi:hypothetical protein
MQYIRRSTQTPGSTWIFSVDLPSRGPCGAKNFELVRQSMHPHMLCVVTVTKDCTTPNSEVTVDSDQKGRERKQVWTNLRKYSGICLE